jgi:hypothetical protein
MMLARIEHSPRSANRELFEERTTFMLWLGRRTVAAAGIFGRAVIVLITVGLIGCSGNVVKLSSPRVDLFKGSAAPGTQALFLTEPLVLDENEEACFEGLKATFSVEKFGSLKAGELHLFPRNVTFLRDYFSTFENADWSYFRTYFDSITDPVSSRVAVIPFPNNQSPDTPIVVQLLSKPEVSSPTLRPCLRADNGNVSTGTVIQAAVYQAGLCTHSIDFQPLLQEIADQFWGSFAGSSSLSNPTEHFTGAISFLAPTTPPPASPHGAGNFSSNFLLGFHYSADLLTVGRDIIGMFEYRFVLENGELKVVPHEIRMESSFWDPSAGPLSVISKVRAGLAETLPEKFAAASAQKQRIRPAGDPRFCETVSDCNLQAAGLASLVKLDTIRAAGFDPPSTVDLQKIRCVLGSEADCQNGNLPFDLSKAWACDVPADAPRDDTRKVCLIRAPIKRTNHMIDRLDLILYDGPEYDNVAFGLSAAIQADPDPQRAKQLMEDLCPTGLRTAPNPPGSLSTSFAKVSRPGP